MVKWKADITFDGKEEKKRFSVGEEFEMTLERADEVQSTIYAEHGIEQVMTRVEEPETEKPVEEQPDAKLDSQEQKRKESAKKEDKKTNEGGK